MFTDTAIFRGRSGCCFTGHRPDAMPRPGSGEETKLKLRLIEAVTAAAAAGVGSFYNGGARGFDLMSAEAVLSVRDAGHPDLRLRLFLPSVHHTDGWPEGDLMRFEYIAGQATEISYAADANMPFAYLLRDRQLVDHADCCICYLKKMSGGTLYTVNYAMERGLPVLNLYGEERVTIID